MNLGNDGGAAAILGNLGLVEKRLLFATALTLTRVTGRVKAAEQLELRRSLDRPTPWTLNSLFLEKATPERLTARVWLKDERAVSTGTPASRYLTPQIEGGKRTLKSFELALQRAGHMPTGTYAVPGEGAKLDGYGNPSLQQILQILSQLQVQLVLGYDRSLPKGTDKRTLSKRRRAFGRAGGQFVAFRDGWGKLPPGIYLATGRDFGARLGYGRTGRLKAVFLFKRRVTYHARVDWWGVAQRTVSETLRSEAQRAGAEVLRVASGAST